MNARLDLAGQRFGRWTAISFAGGRKWHCRCDCGTEKAVDGGSLRSGRSAGCIKCHPALGKNRTHGSSKTRLYRVWEAMKRRCNNPADAAFDHYGGRGITVCEEWMASFEAFQSWAAECGYADHLTIDRKNNNGPYSPDNCRWATHAEQNRNTRRNRPVEFRGQKVFVSDLASEFGIPADVLKNRIRRYGWSVQAAVSTPYSPRAKHEPWRALGTSKSTYYRKRVLSFDVERRNVDEARP